MTVTASELGTATGAASTPSVVVVGNGMVGQRLLDQLVQRGVTQHLRVTAFGDERLPAYDRVNLSAYLEGRTVEELSLADAQTLAQVELITGEAVVAIDRPRRRVITDTGRETSYDTLVLATGAAPFVPPLPNADAPGCFTYRTIDDLDRIRAWARGARTGVVVGGGLLGLEAARALQHLGLQTHVVELASRLMPVQIDDGAGAVLRQRIEALGITVHTGQPSAAVNLTGGRVSGLRLDSGQVLAADLIVFSAGIRPRDQLARDAGLPTAERGGVLVDESCRSADPNIYAIGECAAVHGTMYGLVAPGYAMAQAVAEQLSGSAGVFPGADLSTKLKLLGVDVASFGDAHAAAEGARTLVWRDEAARVYRKLVVDADGERLIGGVLVGDADDYSDLLAHTRGGAPLPAPAAVLLAPPSARGGVTAPGRMADDATVCNCNNVSARVIRQAVSEQDACTPAQVTACTGAGGTCGSCVPLLTRVINEQLERDGVTVDRSLCEHFAYTRQELADLVRVREIRTFAELLHGWGRGSGCAVCKPAVASILASFWNDYVLADDHAGLQDTNDRFLANLQRDGTYSVVPRLPGGEVTPAQLMVIAQVAQDFDLYTKITGGQRVDLFGARLEQLPEIWRRLRAAGLESGHAYGKALRTVKSCVGQAWCRYGVQDSTALAVELELRYRGLRAPHKLKSAVSGCARECAEAQSKDFGVIATEAGWNLYVCGNGGMRPQHAVLLAEDVDRVTLIRYLDRFLMFYVRTADRLERTATWLNRLDGGIDYLRRVIVDDHLGIAADLEAAMARHVESYRCEWSETLDRPERLAQFRTFVNTDDGDPQLRYVVERGQRRPAYPEERAAAAASDDLRGRLLPLHVEDPVGAAP